MLESVEDDNKVLAKKKGVDELIVTSFRLKDAEQEFGE